MALILLIFRGGEGDQGDDLVPLLQIDFALQIVADLGHELHAAADPGDRHGLIGPLAAGIHHECPAQHRFARVGNTIRFYQQIRVRTADHHDFFHPEEL